MSEKNINKKTFSVNPIPRFTGIFIPVEILNHNDLSLLEKMLLSWIDALYCERRRGCFASNRYLGDKLGVQANTIVKAITHLRKLGLIKDISEKGESDRVIVALLGQEMDKKTQVNPTPIGLESYPPMTEILPPWDKNPIPSIIESKDERKEYTLCAPSSLSACVSSSSKKSKPKRCLDSFSEGVISLAAKMLDAIKKANPLYRQPENFVPFLESVEKMIEKDHQDPNLVFKAFEWAVKDTQERGDWKGWQGVICKNKRGRKETNPVELFSQHASTIYAQMSSQPNRKFAPSSNMDAAMEAMEEMNKHAL